MYGRFDYGGPMSGDAISEIRASSDERARLGEVRRLVARSEGISVSVGGEMLELPPSLVRLLMSALEALDAGHAIAVVSEESEVSPAQAALLLGVSRQYVDRLVANDVLPVRRLPNSRYRKIPVRAVLEHRAAKIRKRTDVERVIDAAVAAGLDY